ncbi:MAG: substrate-binding domain-containing protein [Phycisphaeraceae bacterium]
MLLQDTPRRRRVALVLNKDQHRWRRVLRGLLGLHEARDEWELHSVPGLTDLHLDLLCRWKPDGIIADVPDQQAAEKIMQLDIPTVHLADRTQVRGLTSVGVDHHKVGQMAGRHFAELGLRHFAYFGDLDWASSRAHLQGFHQTLTDIGFDARVIEPPRFPTLDMSEGWTSADDRIASWLECIPRPFGLLLGDDRWGLWVAQVIRRARMTIPYDVAMLGIQDDELHCEMTTPPLSSIRLPLAQIGLDAGRLLLEIIDGRADPASQIRLPPVSITLRASTSLLAVEDPDLAQALRFIADSAHLPIQVEDILTAVPVSRRQLERKFRELLGRTPLQEIRRQRLLRVRDLLATTDDSLQQIAERTGFGSMYSLCRVFRREANETPMTFRQRYRRS